MKLDLTTWQKAAWSLDVEDGDKIAVINGKVIVLNPEIPPRYVLITEDLRGFTHEVFQGGSDEW